MKKFIWIVIIILSVLFLCLFLNNTNIIKTNQYSFLTYVKVESNGETSYKSMTKQFVLKIKKMNLEDEMVSSDDYSVILNLNLIQLTRVILNRELNNYYDSYSDTRYLSKNGIHGLDENLR